MDWAEKYRPRRLGEITGNAPAIRRMYEWAVSWTRESRPLILYGKPGTGKTSSAHALAADMHWDVVELNASDQRTKAVIEKTAGLCSTTGSLTGASRKLILLDEADNLQGTADRGGARAIIDVIASSRQPIILIANDLYGLPAELRAKCEPVQFRALQARAIASRLRFICASEQVLCTDTAIKELAEDAGGDMRQAINMLHAAAIGRAGLDGTEGEVSRKDERASLFDIVSAVFRGVSGEELLRLSYEVDETPDTIEQWIDANMHHITSLDRRTRGYQCLSHADAFIGNTYRQQHYTLWRYATAVMLLGVSHAAAGCGIRAKISTPERWKRMAGYRKQKSLRSGFLTRLAMILHMPRRTLRDRYLGLVSLVIDHNPAAAVDAFGMDADELNLIIHDKVRAQAAIKSVAAATEQREKEREKAALRQEKPQKPAPSKKAPSDDVKKTTAVRSPGPGNQATLDGF